MIDKVEMVFYITPNQPEQIYIIEDSVGSYLASVYRTYRFKETTQHQLKLTIEYELQLNVCKTFNGNEKMMIYNYYHNLVNTLTHDMQTIYTDEIAERVNLPFYENFMHVKVVK